MVLPLALLAAGLMRHYGWDLFPEGTEGVASKGLGGALTALLVGIVYSLRPSVEMAAVSLWLAWENAQIAVCSFWWVLDPWPLKPNVPMCSDRVGADLGAVGVVAAGALASWLYERGRTSG